MEPGLVVGAGQTLALAGIFRDGTTLGAGATLIATAGGLLDLFGGVAGPAEGGVAEILVSAGATLFVAETIDASASIRFAGAGSTLQLASVFLDVMAAPLAGFVPGLVIDVVSGEFTDAAVIALPGGGTGLALKQDGTALGTLGLATAVPAGTAPLAVADGFDGTRVLLGPVFAGRTPTAPGTGLGVTLTWGGGAGGRWGDPGAWTGAATAPGAGDTAEIAGPVDAVLRIEGDGGAARADITGIVALGGGFAFGTLVVGSGPGDALAIGAGDAVAADTASLAAGVLQVAGAGATLGVAGTLSAAGLVKVADGGVLGAGALALAGGTLLVDPLGSLVVGAGPAITGTGTVTVAAGASAVGAGWLRCPLDVDGVVRASGGVLGVYGGVTGNGGAEIAPGSTLYVPYGIALGGTITFLPAGGDGGGTLELFGSAASCATVLAGFGPEDGVDIASATITQVAWTPPGPGAGGIGVLDLGAAGALELMLADELDPGRARFAVAADGLGGTRISMIPCFRAGTNIATPDGPRAVERIAPGDRVITLSGAARQVRWVGRRGYTAVALRAQPQLRAVRIGAGAMGPGVPVRELFLSPRHAVLVETPGGRRLVPAVALVDGTSVVRAEERGGESYVHLELDDHDVVLAEGLPVETFRRTGAHDPFQRQSGCPGATAPACWPELDRGPLLAAWVRQSGRPVREGPVGHLDRAILEPGGIRVQGWARAVGGRPSRVTLMLDGARCGVAIANQWRPDLDNAGFGACAFDTLVRAGRPRGLLSAVVDAPAGWDALG